MTSLDLSPARLDLTVQQGSLASASLTFKDSAGSALVLTGYLARMMVRQLAGDTDPTISLSTSGTGLSWTDAAGGVLALSIAADTLAAVTPGPYIYDLELVPPDTPTGHIEAQARAYISGRFIVKPQVTK